MYVNTKLGCELKNGRVFASRKSLQHTLDDHELSIINQPVKSKSILATANAKVNQKGKLIVEDQNTSHIIEEIYKAPVVIKRFDKLVYILRYLDMLGDHS